MNPLPLSPSPTRSSRMTLIEAATVMERLQVRAAHVVELEALRMARDALLTTVSEGFLHLHERLASEAAPRQQPDR